MEERARDMHKSATLITECYRRKKNYNLVIINFNLVVGIITLSNQYSMNWPKCFVSSQPEFKSFRNAIEN